MNEQKLQNIRQAESMAKQIIISVEDEIQVMIQNAHNEVISIMEKTKNDMRNYETDLLAKYKNEGEKKASSILSDLDRAIQEVSSSADKKKKEVVNFLNEQMKVSYGNS